MAKSYDIAVIPGDGTGPEVVAEGIKVLDAVAALERVKLNFACFDFGGARYLRTGEILPEGAIN
jgi:3-isopropylmalate dehydrogenase